MCDSYLASFERGFAVPLLPDIKPHKLDNAQPGRCPICGGTRSNDLPTGCPGRAMTDQEREGVRAGRLNFFDGRFVAFD